MYREHNKIYTIIIISKTYSCLTELLSSDELIKLEDYTDIQLE